MMNQTARSDHEDKEDNFALIGFLVTIGVIGISGIIAAFLVFFEN